MKFSEKVFKLRKIKGLTQDEFAAAVGVSRQAVYKWESGQSYPEVPKLLEMKILFGISIDDLLDESYEVVIPEKQKKKRISRDKKEKIELAVKEEMQKEDAKEEEILVAAAPAAKGEEAPASKEEENAAPVEEDIFEEKAEAEKKRGFFGRLFGRK